MLSSFNSTAMTFLVSPQMTATPSQFVFPLIFFCFSHPCSTLYSAARSISLKHMYPSNRGPQWHLTNLAGQEAVRFQWLHRNLPVGKIFLLLLKFSKKKDYKLPEDEAVKTFKSTWIWALKLGETQDVEKGRTNGWILPACPSVPSYSPRGSRSLSTQVWETYQQSMMETGKGNRCFD